MPRNYDVNPLPCGWKFCPAPMRFLWFDANMPIRHLCQAYQRTDGSIRHKAEVLGVLDDRQKRQIATYSRAQFIAAWNDKKLSRDEVAALFGMTGDKCGRHAKLLGLGARKGGQVPVKWPADFSEMWLAGVRTKAIADLVVCDPSTVLLEVRRRDLARRTPGARFKMSVAEFRLARSMAVSARVTQLAFEITGRETKRHFAYLKELAA